MDWLAISVRISNSVIFGSMCIAMNNEKYLQLQLGALLCALEKLLDCAFSDAAIAKYGIYLHFLWLLPRSEIKFPANERELKHEKRQDNSKWGGKRFSSVLRAKAVR